MWPLLHENCGNTCSSFKSTDIEKDGGGGEGTTSGSDGRRKHARGNRNWNGTTTTTKLKCAEERYRMEIRHSATENRFGTFAGFVRTRLMTRQILSISHYSDWVRSNLANLFCRCGFLPHHLLIFYPLSHLTTILFPWNKNGTQRMLMLKRWSRVHVIVVLANPIAWECVWWIGNSWKVKSISSIAY